MLGLARMWDLGRRFRQLLEDKGASGTKGCTLWSSLVLPVAVCSDAAAADALCPREQDCVLPEQSLVWTSTQGSDFHKISL